MALNTFAPQFPPATSTSEGLTATASGTQATGLALVSRYNVVSVCATSGDSVVLPPAVPDLTIYVENDGAAPCGVYPFLGGFINAGAVNAVFLVTNAKRATFTATGTNGKWMAILSA